MDDSFHCKSETKPRRWLGFALISAIFHAALIAWIHPGIPKSTPEAPNRPTLEVSIEPGKSVAKQAEMEPSQAETKHIEGPQNDASTAVDDLANSPVEASTEPQARSNFALKLNPVPPPVPEILSRPPQMEDREDQHEERPMAPTAAEMIVSARRAIPEIVERIEGEVLQQQYPSLFDPRFRRKLDASRQADQERKQAAAAGESARHHVEVAGEHGDSISLRIGDNCWVVPVDDGSHRFDARIWMRDLSCPEPRGPKLLR